MPEFFNVLAPDDAIEVVRNRLTVQVETEVVDTADSLGRVTAESITSSEDLPAYPRSAMDGFSVRARDTFGATEGLPAYLEVVGDVPTGCEIVEGEFWKGQIARHARRRLAYAVWSVLSQRLLR